MSISCDLFPRGVCGIAQCLSSKLDTDDHHIRPDIPIKLGTSQSPPFSERKIIQNSILHLHYPVVIRELRSQGYPYSPYIHYEILSQGATQSFPTNNKSVCSCFFDVEANKDVQVNYWKSSKLQWLRASLNIFKYPTVSPSADGESTYKWMTGGTFW